MTLDLISVHDRIEFGKNQFFSLGISPNHLYGYEFFEACPVSVRYKPPLSALNSKVSAMAANESLGSRVDWRFEVFPGH
jgi:hypothetical protein